MIRQENHKHTFNFADCRSGDCRNGDCRSGDCRSWNCM